MLERAHLLIRASGRHPFGITIWNRVFWVHCERHVIYRVSLTLIPQIFTRRALIYLYESGCFSAARKFNRGLATANTAISPWGKANAIFSKRGLIHFGNHFNAWSFSYHILRSCSCYRSLYGQHWCTNQTFIGEVGAAWTVYGFVNGGLVLSPLTDRVSLHWEKQEAVRGLSRIRSSPLLNFIFTLST